MSDNKRVVIDYAMDSLKDIKRAERLKTKCENDGYTLVHESDRIYTGRFIYIRKQ